MPRALSGIYYRYRIDHTLVVLVRRFLLRYVAMSAQASIAGKITVQVDALRDARSFWWGASKVVLSQL